MGKQGVTAPLCGLLVIGCAPRTRRPIVIDPWFSADIVAPKGFGR